MTEQKEIHGFLVTRAEGLTDEQRENNRKWVEALRSGEYAQTHAVLRDSCGYCCLGLGELVTGGEFQAKDKYDSFRVTHGGESVMNVLTTKAQKLLKMDGEGGFRVLDSAGEQWALWELNDVKKLSFYKISDLIAYRAGLEDGPAPSLKQEKGQ